MADSEDVQKVLDQMSDWFLDQAHQLVVDEMLYGVSIRRADGTRIDPRTVLPADMFVEETLQ